MINCDMCKKGKKGNRLDQVRIKIYRDGENGNIMEWGTFDLCFYCKLILVDRLERVIKELTDDQPMLHEG
jgi:hypothetical protein